MKSKLSFLGVLLASGKMNNTMKSTLIVACMLLKSAWQAVLLRSALATLLLVPLVAVHAIVQHGRSSLRKYPSAKHRACKSSCGREAMDEIARWMAKEDHGLLTTGGPSAPQAA